MAPFGRNFLKAHLKSRAKNTGEVPGKEIQVWVCNEEKVVCGVTKHTTCVDVVQALLEDHQNVPERLLHGEPKDFCLLERWKGFERALPPLTRILRLWSAWGDQRPFIQFVLIKASEFVPPSKGGPKLKGAKPKRRELGPAQYSQSLPMDQKKRMVKKAFRKLEKIQKDKSSLGGGEVDSMVQLLISQDHTIQQQIQCMRAMDLEIERLELQLSQEALPETALEAADGQQTDHQLQEYAYTSNGVAQLELQVQRHQELIEKLCQDIDSELRSGAWADVEAAGLDSGTTSDADPPSYTVEVLRLRAELESSMLTGLCLHSELSELERELKRHSATLLSKDQECWQLASQLSSTHIEEVDQEAVRPGPPRTQSRCSVPQAVKLKQSPSSRDVTDTDSDTGISSTHSQDSLSPCLDMPPPLDTDV